MMLLSSSASFVFWPGYLWLWAYVSSESPKSPTSPESGYRTVV
ncbi:hypothetical protein [Sorangium sp. So ce381]